GGNAADIRNYRLGVVVAQIAGIGIGHECQPTPVRVDAVTNRAIDLAVGPALQSPRRGQVGRHERPDAEWQVLADVEATGKRAGSRMAPAAKAIDKGLAARDSFGGCLALAAPNPRAPPILPHRPTHPHPTR